MGRERDAARARLEQLAGASGAYTAVLGEKERFLRGSDDPRGAELLSLAEESGRLTGEVREVDEALRAGRQAQEALSRLADRLSSASGWSTYDTFFGGGAIASAIKHSRLDDAARDAAYADRCLAVLRTELADVDGEQPAVPRLGLDGLTRFVDIWFDNAFTDFAVRGRIKQAQESVARSTRLVGDVMNRLRQRSAQARARLAAIQTRRDDLLTR
ncbi:hypothetical protein [Rugosimonospora acidiphila]|uniref:hypothetical protein n=1 Tax=Rugosimonospora acidiphila TaxID=556531 RepID=UPI0031ED2B3C